MQSARQRGVLFFAVGCLGFSAFLTQLTLMRELLSAFSGNELVFGIALGSWLLLTGIGSLAGGLTGRVRRSVEVLVVAQVWTALVPIAAVFLLLLSRKRFKDYSGSAKAVPLAAVGLLAAEIMMGGMVVLLELPMQLTTIHFMTGMVVFLLAFYMMTFDGAGEPARFSLRKHSGMFFAMGLLAFFQAALGAYVRHSQAGLACEDFPTCMGEWIPPVANWLEVVQMSHRFMALLLFVTFSVLYTATFIDSDLASHRNTSFMLLVLSVAQIAVGALVVLSGLSFVATAIHLVLALCILSLLFHMWAKEVRKVSNPIPAT